MKEDLIIIDYGAGNVQSVIFALERLGYSARLSADPDEIRSAGKVIFPGVGAAGLAMEALKKTGLDQLIPELKQPVLGICLGMQLMCRHSEEDNTAGLGIFDVEVKKFEPKFKVPHMGWNRLESTKGKLFSALKNDAYVYFVHSFYVPENEDTVASCDYMHPFSAALQKDNFYACQFHPEKSGQAGEQIVKSFLAL